MQAFAMFASDLDAATRAQLTRGERLMELLKQPQYTPYPVAEQVASVWAGTKGYLDDLDVADVLPFDGGLPGPPAAATPTSWTPSSPPGS